MATWYSTFFLFYNRASEHFLCSKLFCPCIQHCKWKVKVKATQLCLALCDPMYNTVHGILQARALEWVAFSFSRGPSKPRGQTQVSCIAGGFFTRWATREAHIQHCWKINIWNIALGNGASASLRKFLRNMNDTKTDPRRNRTSELSNWQRKDCKGNWRCTVCKENSSQCKSNICKEQIILIQFTLFNVYRNKRNDQL